MTTTTNARCPKLRLEELSRRRNVMARYRQLAAGKAVAGQFPSRPSTDPNRVRAAQDGPVNAGRLFAALLTLQSISGAAQRAC